MNRHLLRNTLACAALAALFLSAPASAKKKPEPGAPAMTFDTTEATPQGGKKAATKDATGAAPGSKDGGLAFAPEAPSAPASKVLERALKLYDQEDYYSATIELNKVVEGQTADDEANKQRAEFFMGKGLFKLKFFSASLSYFDRIVQKGSGHRYYRKTLEWLASLSQYLPESAGVLEKIGKYTKSDLDQPALEPVRDELYYLLGRYHYQQRNFKEAVELFAAVPEKSEFYPKAKFFEGITKVRENKGKEASDAFKSILRKVKQYEDPDKVPKILKEFEELANLSLGRVFYTTHQYDLSIKYFEKIPGPDARGGASPDWLPSLF
jgi:tetratricopeptide (TPR) repeat protein